MRVYGRKVALRIIICLMTLLITVQVQACGSPVSAVITKQDSLGNVIALWIEKDPDKWSIPIRTASRFATGEWTEITNISNTDGFCELPLLEITSNGNAIALWLQTERTSVNNYLMMSTYTIDTRTWSEPVLVSDVENERILNTFYSISLGDKGEFVIFWAAMMKDGKAKEENKVWRSASGTLNSGLERPVTVGNGYPL